MKQSKLKFHETLYHWTLQLEPDQIQNCMRSLQENHCGDVHQVGLRVRYVLPEDCLHFIAVASQGGRIRFMSVRRTYSEVVEALADFTGEDAEAARELLFCEMLNYTHRVAFARADHLMISPCCCHDPESHMRGNCPACGRDMALSSALRKPDVLALLEDGVTILVLDMNHAVSVNMVNEFLAYCYQRLAVPASAVCSYCSSLESAMQASPKNGLRA